MRAVAIATAFTVPKLLVEVETLFETVNTAGRVYELLFACKERMALGTDFDRDVFFCRCCFDYVTTVTFDCCGFVIRMDSFSHCFHLAKIELYIRIFV